jgi:hypothetical protein
LVLLYSVNFGILFGTLKVWNAFRNFGILFAICLSATQKRDLNPNHKILLARTLFLKFISSIILKKETNCAYRYEFIYFVLVYVICLFFSESVLNFSTTCLRIGCEGGARYERGGQHHKILFGLKLTGVYKRTRNRAFVSFVRCFIRRLFVRF